MMRRSDGFTLVEVMIVVVVLGILVMIAVPRMSTSYEKAKLGEGVQLLTSLRASQSRYCLDHGDCGTSNYPSPCSDLDIAVTPTNFNDPSCDSDGTITLVRKTSAYTLSVDAAGTVTCKKADASDCDQVFLNIIPPTM